MWDEESKWVQVRDSMQNSGRDFVLGSYYTDNMKKDIKHVGFSFARYKFTAKLLENIEELEILELGCNEGIGAIFLEQMTSLKKYMGVDLDDKAINWSKKYIENTGETDIKFLKKNFLKDVEYGKFNAVISLDVIEHIRKEEEQKFVQVIKRNLKEDGIAVIGTPNIAMSPYASEESKIAHVNLYDKRRLCQTMKAHFSQVFMFGMNDEVVHTGFSPMSCYLFALCCNPKW